MTIGVGDRIPTKTLKEKTAEGISDVSTEVLCDGTVILFGVPGAYTPTCTKQHLPSFVENASKLHAKGVDKIVCLSVNDPFVLEAWAQAAGATGEVRVLADWDGQFTEALGLSFDGSGAGLGKRCKRFSMLLRNGKVESLDVEDNPSDMLVSGAAACLSRL